MPIPIVSFFSDVDDTRYYSTCAGRFMSQCDALGIEHHIVERRYGGDWISNVKAKPTFLREMYDQLGRPFLWVDVDCDVLEFPGAANALACDWACVPNDAPNDTPLFVCDCVHLVGQSTRTRALLDTWVEACADPGTKGSHSAFCRILPAALRDGLEIAYLPPSYAAGPVIRLGLANTPSKTGYLRAMQCK
jgi:hypothetical protein